MSKQFIWTDDLALKFIKDYSSICKELKGTGRSILERFKELNKPKPLFITLDQQPIYEGDNYYFIDDGWGIRYTGDGYNWVGKDIKAFVNEDLATQYKIYHQPCLSLSDVVACIPGYLNSNL